MQKFEAAESFPEDEFKKAHLRIMEVSPKLKELISGLSGEKKTKFENKAEKKVNRA